jgi:hypothetical protein
VLCRHARVEKLAMQKARVELARSLESVLQVTDQPRSGPCIWVVALVPVDALRQGWLVKSDAASPLRGGEGRTYKDFRPATRVCVAQEPPRTTLCLPSKKSATGGFGVSQGSLYD